MYATDSVLFYNRLYITKTDFLVSTTKFLVPTTNFLFLRPTFKFLRPILYFDDRLYNNRLFYFHDRLIISTIDL